MLLKFLAKSIKYFRPNNKMLQERKLGSICGGNEAGDILGQGPSTDSPLPLPPVKINILEVFPKIILLCLWT